MSTPNSSLKSSKATAATLFVSTYEMPRHLGLVCAALERQSARDFEILFCDDGSGPETASVISDFAIRVPWRVEHIRQEHQGFRKCRILNEGVRRAKGGVFVFLDGDCVPHRHYIRDHLDHQEEGRFLAGRRVEIGPRLAAALTPDEVRAGFFDWLRPSLIGSMLARDSEYLNRCFRIASPGLRTLLKLDRVADLKGCNYSVSRKSLEAINGFDEEYEGYGREDTDVELRLTNLGLRIKSMKGLALQYHVWHERRAFTPTNDERLEELKRSGRVRCRLGIRAT